MPEVSRTTNGHQRTGQECHKGKFAHVHLDTKCECKKPLLVVLMWDNEVHDDGSICHDLAGAAQ